VDLEHANLPDPESEALRCVMRRLQELELRLEKLEN